MDYTALMKNECNMISRVGIIGATKGYGYTLLAQIPEVKNMHLRCICSRHTDECFSVLEETGFTKYKIVECNSIDEIRRAPEDAIIITADYKLVMETGITAMVECTGNTTIGSDAALIALQKGINVYMVSKETDSVTGTYMNQVAARNKAVYTLVNGDQPRNLLDLYSWAKLLGLEVICAGKSSEYDFVWDRETCEFTYKDGIHESELLPDMHKYWHYEGTQTLEGRNFLLKKYKETIAADLCEMTLVSNVSGLMPATPFMHYPIAKASELADIFIPKEDGGILDSTGVVDVFYNLREKDEASFCGGEFVIVRCKNAKSWDILASKGHLMSKNGKYCCIYLPYHFMGLETPVTILQGDFMGIGTHPETRQVPVMAGVAQKDLPAGTVLKVHGHHHQIDGLLPELLIRSNAKDAAPFYLLNNSILLRDVEEGQPITLEDVDLTSNPAYALYLEGLKLDN